MRGPGQRHSPAGRLVTATRSLDIYLKIEGTEFADRWNVGMKKRGVTSFSKVLGPRVAERMGYSFTEMGKPAGRAGSG